MGVDVRVAPIRRDQVMQILFLRVPFPGRDHDVALDALRALRLVLRQLASRDAVGPVGIVSERRPAERAGELIDHLLTGLSGLDAAHPGLFRGFDIAEGCGNRPGRQLPQLMTADAADVLHLLQPVGLRDFLGNVALAAELVLVRYLQHRIPVDRRIILRGRLGVRRRNCRQVQHPARRTLHLG